ncbi:hypothetical protein M0208_12015 [Sphingomonas sp. SUN019]|uniref:DUF7946 domain-containing protein n=1 Tax=Sphingomonas sp. SUN019 TaxID=2937788 RepID=UPI002164166D|nr:hypothetical protein [Sphingomonas sp. SUN019]UVO51199.1 hypothetical protein M0208_12015 [Sphingomonas sp. SUN019]
MSEWIISFRGLDADLGHIEALAGIESAAGIARALTLIGHYAATGSVRHRFPFDDTVKFYLEGTEEGSFNWKLVATVGGPLALGLATNALYDLSKLTMNKAIGEEPTSISKPVEQLNETKSGDIDALVEAIEPALKKAHYGIGETAAEIIIQETATKRVVVRFNSVSKSYLMDSIEADDGIQDVSISALNVNDKTGRAYFLDLNRTIPFRVSKDADPKTMSVLSAGIDRYANRIPAPIRITFSRVEAIDGRLKRIVILKAEDVSDEL